MIILVLRILLRRLVVSVPIVLVVSLLLFAVLRLLPVDPAAMSVAPSATKAEIEAKRVEMGLDRPVAEQYTLWLGRALRGDFGTSIHLREDVGRLVAQTLPPTLELALCAIAVATVLGLGGGLAMFHLRGGTGEHVADFGSTVMMSIPEFLWGLFFILLFGVAWNLLPFTGRLDPQFQQPSHTGFLLLDTLIEGRPNMFRSAVEHMVLPALALGLGFAPPIMRVLRSSLLDAYHDDYIQQARLRGIGEGRILVRHALRNAILPTLTLMGVQFGFLFGGTLLIEVIYSYPGLGNLMVDAIRNADLPIVQTVGLVYCLVVLTINAVVDVLVILLNPRLRSS